MKIWIIGKWGMLAQAIQRKCREKRIDYIATTKEEVDITNEQSLRAQFETLAFTHLINCSGYTAVDRAEQESKQAYALNAQSVALLAILSNERKNPLIHFSTDYVFDGKKGYYKEHDERAPLSEYGKSKEFGERLLMEYYPQALLIRTSWLFGKEGSSFVTKMIAMMKNQERISIVDDQIGRPTYADDLAEATLSILDRSGIYHFANKGAITWYDFAQIIQKKIDGNKSIRCQQIQPISSKDFKREGQRPLSSILLTEKFSPRHWEIGLEEVLHHALGSK